MARRTTIDIRVFCPRCGREIVVLSGDAHLGELTPDAAACRDAPRPRTRSGYEPTREATTRTCVGSPGRRPAADAYSYAPAQVQDIEIDLLARTVRIGNGGRRIDLTPLEHGLLWLLAANAGGVVSRLVIEESLWGGVVDTSSNVVDQYVHRLRKKLGDDARRPTFTANAPDRALGGTPTAQGLKSMVRAIENDRFLDTLQQLLEVDARDLGHALDHAATVVADALGAEKVDAFVWDNDRQVLTARGTSETPLGRKQKAMGLDILSMANGGRTVEVFETGEDYLHPRVVDDERELVGIKELGVRSAVATPLVVGGDVRGVLEAASVREGAFDRSDLQFLRAVAHWVGTLAHRAELRERATQAALDEGRRLAAEELVTVLAHDLGNFLTPLRGRLEFCLRDARRDERSRDIERLEGALANVDAITALTGDLLDVSRIEEGMLRLEPSAVTLAQLVANVARALESERVSIRVDIPEDLSVRADLRRLRQILTNLIGNAVRHSPKGGTVVVAACRGATAVQIRVTDEGPGVPSEMAPRLFARFARGPRSTGLGLGLYLAERIAVAHGGSLSLDSTTTGATFVVSVPA